MRLHLGCNDDIRAGYVNVDRTPPADMLIDLRTGLRAEFGTDVALHPKPWVWPWDSSSVEEIIAHDVFEHIDNPKYPGNKGIIWCLNESHRVLQKGGILDLVVPCLPGIAPWVDPTHVSVWTADLRYYFDERWAHPKGERGRLGPGMGITALFKTLPTSKSGVDWKPIQYAKDAPERSKLFLKLEAVK